MADAPADTKKDLSQVVSGSSEITEQAQPRSRRKSKYDGPNQEFLRMLMALGISKNAAEKVMEIFNNFCEVLTCQAYEQVSDKHMPRTV